MRLRRRTLARAHRDAAGTRPPGRVSARRWAFERPPRDLEPDLDCLPTGVPVPAGPDIARQGTIVDVDAHHVAARDDPGISPRVPEKRRRRRVSLVGRV